MENNAINISDFKDITYKTREVAKMLNTNTQTIKSYCTTFRKILDGSNVSGRRGDFTGDDINKLKMIQYLSKQKHYKPEQIIEYFLYNNSTSLSSKKELEFIAETIYTLIKPEIENTIKSSINTTMEEHSNNIRNDIKINRTEITGGINKILRTNDSLINSMGHTKNLIKQIENNQNQYLSRVDRRKQKNKWYNNLFKLSSKKEK
ncbi:MerR family transcriptional regulator [Clostridium sp. WILCCON 0269]|uniref:MerR family transcriptional regulator n=1 Tax=Candidatus Clostridium eludens TaxID=3381663 RepID=A0ABW8SEN8_9CLOT